MGEGGVKNSEKLPTSFLDGPRLNAQVKIADKLLRGGLVKGIYFLSVGIHFFCHPSVLQNP